jgi:hypothetical protein
VKKELVRWAVVCTAVVFVAFATTGLAQDFNVDFSSHFAGPAATFGAAASQPGTWNVITAAGPTTLLNLNGTSSAASISVTVAAVSGFGTFNGFGGSHTGDLQALLDDNFFSTLGAHWSLTISGLSNGLYDFYYYAPSNGSVDTGPFTVNGIAASSIAGDDSSPLTEGLNWEVMHDVSVTNGTMTVLSTDTGTGPLGLAGLQIAVVPEPSTVCLLGIGIIGLATLSLRKSRAR